jgi:hypothetical protein
MTFPFSMEWMRATGDLDSRKIRSLECDRSQLEDSAKKRPAAAGLFHLLLTPGNVCRRLNTQVPKLRRVDIAR